MSLDPEVLDPATIERLRRLARETQRPGEDVLAELFSLYDNDAGRRVDAVQAALARGDAAAAAAAAHALKGASANVGALRVRACCADVEAAARQGDVQAANDHAATLAREVARARTALASALAPDDGAG